MMNRRRFLHSSAGTALLTCFPSGLSRLARAKVAGQIEKRGLGKTGELLSMIGFGGIVVMNATAAESSQRVSTAIDYGVNYFDVAPSYGNAEQMLGPALEPYRKKVFLACKTDSRDSQGALEELEGSLKRLRTDYFDLYQMHAVTKVEDAKQILGPGGALEGFQKAQKDGKIRFIGFSAHSVEAALTLLDGFDFDTILFPVNFKTWNAGNFGPQVLQKAKEKGTGVLAIKALANGPWPEAADRIPKCWYQPLTDEQKAELALRFTLSHPVTAALPPGNENLFRRTLDLALRFEPLSDAEVSEIKHLAAEGQPLFRYPSPEA
jgi:predicted aldo/keto reductase-like oxidoreductase